MKRVDKGGQIWVETVIYTLIGLAIIGLVLAVSLPKINEKKDGIAIERSIEAMGIIDEKIYEVQRAVGNRRTIDLQVGKGEIIIDMEEDSISWVLDSRLLYSEEGAVVPVGPVDVITRKGSPWEIEIKRDYDVDIQFDGDDVGTKTLGVSPTPYGFVVENVGKNSDGNIIVDLRVN